MPNEVEQAIQNEISQILSEIISFRRKVHSAPELSLQEWETSRLIHETLQSFGLMGEYITPDKRGIRLIVDGNLPGDTIVLRADMDALPMQEITQLPFCSKNAGVMHACGHDMNSAFLMGAAVVLSRMREKLRGRLVFLFQCAEENFLGAKEAIAAGVLDGLNPRYLFAFHGNPGFKVGTIALRCGQAMSAGVKLRIVVKGQGGHGGFPNSTTDPITIAAQIVMGLQTLAARKHHPSDPLVISICSIQSGTVFNVTPADAVMEGTVRYFNERLGEQLPVWIKRLCEGTAQAYGANCEVEYELMCPAMITGDEIFNYADRAFKKEFGSECVFHAPQPVMGSEDFAWFSPFGQVMQVRIGTQFDDPRSKLPLHNNGVVFSEDAIPIGIRAICALAFENGEASQ
ncbi:MAG: M20 family metallopeptidase [Clostridia bacterium]|nr:M20 family metallopeptidase [Clostridia bacterium]